MIERPRLNLPYPPRLSAAACDGFVARMRARLQEADADGLLPWAPHAMADCKAGTAVGVKIAGSIRQLHALNTQVDGEALGLTRFVLGVFPESAAWLVAQDPATPREFTGSRSQLSYAMFPLISAGLMAGVPDGMEANFIGGYGCTLHLHGVRRVRVLPLCSSILTEGAVHG